MPTTQPAPTYNPEGPADVPSPVVGPHRHLYKPYEAIHESFIKRGKSGPIGILFIGDSITAAWYNARDVWQKYYGKDHPANFGIPGDRTQNVLWRIDNGELAGIDPKVVVLLIGTNNVGLYSAKQIAHADTKIVDQIHKKLPATQILLLAIFPRGHNPNDPNVAKMRMKIDAANQQLSHLNGKNNTTYLNIGPKFLDASGMIQPQIMKDYLHPTHKGFEIWAAAMQPTLDRLLK